MLAFLKSYCFRTFEGTHIAPVPQPIQIRDASAFQVPSSASVGGAIDSGAVLAAWDTLHAHQTSAFDPKRTTVGVRCLEIFGPQSGVFGDASKHLGANFLSVMKCEDEIRPTFAPEGAM
jgi:hypothetical protein